VVIHKAAVRHYIIPLTDKPVEVELYRQLALLYMQYFGHVSSSFTVVGVKRSKVLLRIFSGGEFSLLGLPAWPPKPDLYAQFDGGRQLLPLLENASTINVSSGCLLDLRSGILG